MTRDIRINRDRLWRSLMDLAAIGATPKGGNCRLALSGLDGQGRDLVVDWMKAAGLAITVDQGGNIFGRRAGRNPALAPGATRGPIEPQPPRGQGGGWFGGAGRRGSTR